MSNPVGNAERSRQQSFHQNRAFEIEKHWVLQHAVIGSELVDESNGSKELTRLPESFRTTAEYYRSFAPLLFAEAREELRRSMKEAVSSGQFAPVTIRSVSFGTHWSSCICSFDAKSDALSTLVESTSGASGGQNPYICMLCSEKPTEALLEPGCNAATNNSTTSSNDYIRTLVRIGAVCERERNGMPGNHAELWFRHDALDAPMRALLAGRKGDAASASCCDGIQYPQWHILCGTKLITQEAELDALSHVHSLRRPLKRTLLQPSLHPGPRFASCEAPELAHELQFGFANHLEASFNQPQQRALAWASAQASGAGYWPFTLIQGPPGTGKTHTIWGILNVVHVVHFNRFYNAHVQHMTGTAMHDAASATLATAATETPSDDPTSARNRKPKVLVCALSNAGVDVVLDRVVQRGFVQNNGSQYFPPICRVGSGLETTHNAQTLQAGRCADGVLDMQHAKVDESLQICKSRRHEIENYIAHTRSVLELTREQSGDTEHLADLQRRIGEASEDLRKMDVELYRLDLARQVHSSHMNHAQARVLLEASFVDEAEIVFTTLASSCKKVFQRINQGFDEVVLDEAAQASELSTLIPLQRSAKSLTMVGDTSQLPATVLSQDAENALLGRSLFERLTDNGAEPLMLTLQYRMNTEIRKFPSKCFYRDRLVDSDSVQAREPMAFHSIWPLHSYMVFDVQRGLEKRSKQMRSLKNTEEAKLATLLIARALCDVDSSNHSIAIITPYRDQRQVIRSCLKAQLGNDSEHLQNIRVETVDSFQGQEAELVVFSAVRASQEGGVGFLADTRRMNVALTRARQTLWVLGNSSSLRQVNAWKQLYDDASERGLVVYDASTATVLSQYAEAALLHVKS